MTEEPKEENQILPEERKAQGEEIDILQNIEDEKPADYVNNEERYTEVDNDFLLNPVEGFDMNNINSINNQDAEKSKEEEEIKTTKPTNEEKKAEGNSPLFSPNKNTYDLKIILLGEMYVGKSSIIRRYLVNTFIEEIKCSLGCENKRKKVDIDLENEAVLQIWDTAGEEKHDAVTKQYYNDSNGVMVVYDITKEDSFKKLEKWIKYINNYAPKGVTIMIIGNKTDLINDKVDLGDKLNTIKEKYLYYEVSAKTGTNISLAFESLAMKIIENMKNQKDIDKEPARESIPLKRNKFKQKLKKCHC